MSTAALKSIKKDASLTEGIKCHLLSSKGAKSPPLFATCSSQKLDGLEADRESDTGATRATATKATAVTVAWRVESAATIPKATASIDR